MWFRVTPCASILYLFVIASTVRVSPKLDFGTDNNAPDNAKFRPIFQSGSFNHGSRVHANKLHGVDVTCVPGICNLTDKETGVSTDVLVHVKTNVDVGQTNNTTEVIPEVPIIVGTKANSFPTYEAPNSYNELPPLPISTLVRNRALQTSPQINSSPYAPGYQDIPKGPNLYQVYNEQNSNVGNIPLPEFTWNNGKRSENAASYNPLEFKKVYRSSWSDLNNKWAIGGIPNNGYTNPPNWTPCICPNPETHYYQAAPSRY